MVVLVAEEVAVVEALVALLAPPQAAVLVVVRPELALAPVFALDLEKELAYSYLPAWELTVRYAQLAHLKNHPGRRRKMDLARTSFCSLAFLVCPHLHAVTRYKMFLNVYCMAPTSNVHLLYSFSAARPSGGAACPPGRLHLRHAPTPDSHPQQLGHSNDFRHVSMCRDSR